MDGHPPLPSGSGRSKPATSSAAAFGLRSSVAFTRSVAHWTQSHQPATIIMPTGTGKTETMLAALVAYIRGPLLVVVPSQSLREQIADKFLRLGLLQELGIIPEGTPLPLVGVVTKRPKSLADLDIFDHCNVVVSTMSALGQGEADALIPAIAERVQRAHRR